MWLPVEMLKEDRFVRLLVKYGMAGYIEKYTDLECTESAVNELWEEFIQVRVRYDFPYWAYSFAPIKDKKTGVEIPFYLNRAQRKVLAMLEDMRKSGKPIKFILLKALW